jgi:hypothetical protein
MHIYKYIYIHIYIYIYISTIYTYQIYRKHYSSSITKIFTTNNNEENVDSKINSSIEDPISMILDEKEMDRQLEQNDEDDGDEDEELSESEKQEIENEKKAYQNEDEDDNMDINLVSDTAIDRSIQMVLMDIFM